MFGLLHATVPGDEIRVRCIPYIDRQCSSHWDAFRATKTYLRGNRCMNRRLLPGCIDVCLHSYCTLLPQCVETAGTTRRVSLGTPAPRRRARSTLARTDPSRERPVPPCTRPTASAKSSQSLPGQSFRSVALPSSALSWEILIYPAAI